MYVYFSKNVWIRGYFFGSQKWGIREQERILNTAVEEKKFVSFIIGI